MRQRTIYSRDYGVLLAMLREAREQAGITQAQLSKSLRMTQSLLSKYERGQLRLDLVQLRSWCKALRLPFAEFVADFDRRIG